MSVLKSSPVKRGKAWLGNAVPYAHVVSGHLLIFTFFTEYAHPLVRTWLVTQANTDVEKSFGVASILLQAALLMSFVLLLVRGKKRSISY